MSRSSMDSALAAGAERLRSGSSRLVVRTADMYVSDMVRLAERDGVSFTPELAAPVYATDKDPGGDPATMDKKRAGVIVVGAGQFLLCRDLGFTRTVATPHTTAGATTTAITLVVKGQSVPGFRISGTSPVATALVIGINPPSGCTTEAAKAVRDEIVALLS